MNVEGAAPEGALRVLLGLGHGRIERVQIISTRPDVAQSLLQGRRRYEVQAAVPRLFSLCAHSQAAAVTLACAAAAGETDNDDAVSPQWTDARAVIRAEHVRESAWQLLLRWPRAIGQVPTPGAVPAARAAAAWTGFEQGREALAAALAKALLDGSWEDWLALGSWPALLDWAASSHSPAARFLHACSLAHDNPDSTVPWLEPVTPGWLASVAEAAARADTYARLPLQRGQPAETGALARLRSDALLGDSAAPPPSRLLARHVARLRELALLLAGTDAHNCGALALAPGSGVAWVDNARGRLVHHVRLQGDRVQLLRIVAPTEWNFHPQGALARGLVGHPAADAGMASQRARWLIDSLDPCVTCRVEFEDA